MSQYLIVWWISKTQKKSLQTCITVHDYSETEKLRKTKSTRSEQKLAKHSKFNFNKTK